MRTDEKLIRIQKCFVGEDILQVVLYFTDNITLLDTESKTEKILCHYDFFRDTQNINKYLTDERRWSFPYHNIPIYQDYKGYYINAILEFNKHYILVTKDKVEDIYVVKDGKEAIMLIKNLSVPNIVENETVEQKQLYDKYKNRVLMAIDGAGHHIDYTKEYLSLIKEYGGLLILKEESNNKGEKEIFIMLDISTVAANREYWITEYRIPFNQYSLEELKYMSYQIETFNGPKIHLRENPNIKRKEIHKAKKLAKKLNRTK